MFTFSKFRYQIHYISLHNLLAVLFPLIGHEAESINNMENQVKINVFNIKICPLHAKIDNAIFKVKLFAVTLVRTINSSSRLI